MDDDYILRLEKEKKITHDKKNFSTINKVFDKKTLYIMESLEKREFIDNFGSPISSGKEAGVFYGRVKKRFDNKFAIDIPEPVECAVKIFRTSTLEFKNREPYLESELRFQNYCTTNSRKLIKLWAEKEVRNLKRLNTCNINSPRVFFLKRNIIIMDFIGENGIPAPRLKDLNMTHLQQYNISFEQLYRKALDLIYEIYNCAKLIHSDLSEYNLLFHRGELFVIDVGQSVDYYHKSGNRFLLMDILNINMFFARQNVPVIDIKEIFTIITNRKLPDEFIDITFDNLKYIPEVLPENETVITEETEKNKREKIISPFDLSNFSKSEIKERRRLLKEKRKEKRMSRNKKHVR